MFMNSFQFRDNVRQRDKEINRLIKELINK